MTDLKAAVFTVLEGWALPLDARKILETAYYAQPEPTPRQLQRIRQRAWQGIKQDAYKFDPEVCFAMGFDAGYGAVASKVEPPQGECGGFDSRPAPLKRQWVGLTDEERDELLNDSTRVPSRLIDWVEQKLKEKNT